MDGETYRVWATEHDNETHDVVKVLASKNYKYRASAIKAVRNIIRDAYESGNKDVVIFYGDTGVTFGVMNGEIWTHDTQERNALIKHMI